MSTLYECLLTFISNLVTGFTIYFFGLRGDLDTKVTNLLIVTFVTVAIKVTSIHWLLCLRERTSSASVCRQSYFV